MKATLIEWEDFKYCNPIINFGWYLVVLKPKNWKECEDGKLNYADWVSSYGFEKAWYNNSKFYVANPHVYGTEEVTDRVGLFAKLPKVSL